MMEEGAVLTKNRARFKDDFTDLVCSWSLDDVFDDNLYTNQVEMIPKLFQSAEHYLGSYIFPLLEETRTGLASAMEIIQRAPFAEVVTIDEVKPHGSLSYDVKVDCWRNRLIERGRELYKTLPGDILVMSDSKPETTSDLRRMKWSWTFASVIGIEGDEIDDARTSTKFKVRTSKEIDVKGGDQKSLNVVFLINITTNKRIWNALHMLKNLTLIEKVLSTSAMVKENCDFCSENHNITLCEKIGSGLLTQLNESQTEAIMASLLRMTCDHNSFVELIWGPPGTGKTRTISVLLFALLRMGYRTLSCAPTNVAITEVANRVIKLVKESFKDQSAKGDLICPLGDILLFGNNDRLKVGSDIEEIFLNYRVKRLVECLSPLTGWRHCMLSMIDFLENCVTHYHIYVENELSKMKEKKNEDEVEKIKLQSLLEFARVQFKALMPPLRRCLIIFCIHVPKSFILDQNFQNIVHLLCLLETLEMMLFREAVTSDQVEELYSSDITMKDGSKECMHTSSLLCVRSQCFSVLRSLRSSLEKLSLPLVVNENSIKEFCFRMASLIFCTASSSYRLHLTDMEPLNVLVIDEAAQLRECESLIPLQLSGLRHAILVGDECQLPATIKSKVSDEAGFGRSLFERLSSLGHSKYLLNVQYRMHPSISLFPNSKFYHNMILDAPNVKSKRYEKCYLPERMFGPYSFINVLNGREERDEDEHSLRNIVEAAVVVHIVQKLFRAWKGSDASLSIGVISPYAAQVAVIQDKLHQKYENLEKFVVKVKSVDGFQGGEEDIIIISTVRANYGGSIGFLSSSLRTNVALTRARHCLWILGNARTLAKSNSIWEELICDAQGRECFFTADEDSDFSKTILDVKKDLDQLEDLLNGDNILFKQEKWKVIFSDDFRKSFGKLTSTCMKKSVINLLLKLASGWRPKRKNLDSVCESSSQIVKQFKVEGLYVVCSIEIISESGYKQVLKVWDILSLEEVPKLLRRLDSIFNMYTDDFISRCKEKSLEGQLEVPKSWSASSNITRYRNLYDNNVGCDSSDSTSDGRSYVENSRVSESLLLMKFYSLSTGVVNHLLSDRDGGELDLPFEVTDEESEIIQFCKSSFILGRSGTGKTTVLTMKLFQKEQIYQLALQGFTSGNCSMSPIVRKRAEVDHSIEEIGGTSLHQLFVTVSPRLCYAIKLHVSRLKSFACGGSFSSETSLMDAEDADGTSHFKDIPDSFVGIPAKKYPLVITFHKFLMMLDGTMSNSYFERFPEIREFSNDNNRSLRSIALQTFLRKKEVNYDRFCFFYWPHFNSQQTKYLDSSRVFTEIISHIKGGLLAGETPDGKLSRQEYILMSESRTSTMSALNRELIYDIFQDYEKMKLERGEFDLSDFVTNIHLRLKNKCLECDKMDFVYIDEVQDLTMRQISLFKYICANVDEGFVFSGDTAQTIARGIDFRFEDIRSLFYNEFVMESKNEINLERKEKGHISDIFNLYQNFRTHAGVLRLAQSVIDLLYHFFRQSVDFLKPETSLIYGEAPVLLEPGSEENAIVTIFGKSVSAGGKLVGFGAEQVILVRDESARDEVSSYVGNQALVLTIVECKGLEFQDVLLYNFFGSSPLRNQWRVVYEYMNEKDLLDSCLQGCFPSFSQARHSVLCSELKQLYVAITRTRQRLWICENKEEFSKPMFDFWKKLCLVQVKKVDDSFAQAMQMASSPAEWKSRGVKLYWEKKYQMATMCFEKAGDTNWEKRAKAAGLRATADQLRGSNPKEACTILREAAEIFDSIGRSESAAECFCDLGEYERAGRIYLEKCGESELKKAGDCFTLASCYKLAADVYAKGNYFSDCLSVCTKGKLFDLGLQYIEYWKQDSPCHNGMTTTGKEIGKIEQDFLESCALSYYELNDNKSMMRYVRAFLCMDFRRNFLNSVNCLDELLLLEEESGNFKEAAEIAKLKGDLIVEVDLLGKAGLLKEASLLILLYVLSSSLWVAGSSGWPLKPFADKEALLKKAMSFAKQHSDQFYELVCTEVLVLSHELLNLYELHRCLSYSQQYKSPRVEMLSIRKILDAHFSSKSLQYEWEDELPVDVKKHMEDWISLNRCSVHTLVYFWNLWKEKMLNIFQYLECMENQNVSKYMGLGEFCLNYFGVRRQFNNLNEIYVLLNPCADWVKKTDCRSMRQSKNQVSVDTKKLASSARRHWHAELISVSVKVLESLEALYELPMKNSWSLFCQSTCLVHIYEVSKFLMLFPCNDSLTRKLRSFLRLSTKYFENVFPLDGRKSLAENMISLRKTELSRTILQGLIVENISTESELTYGQIGRVVMIWLGCGIPTDELCKKIAERFEENFFWKAFIENLSGNLFSEPLGESSSKDSARCGKIDSVQGPSSSDSVHGILKPDPASNISVQDQKKFSLTDKFHDALRDTYSANWKAKDYISPNCFLYLVERLIILVCHSRDFFFTTKYSFLELLIYLQSDVYPSATSVSDMQLSPETVYDFVAMMVQQFLYNTRETAEWIAKSNIDFNQYYPLLMLRLVVIMCLLCLNSGKYFAILSGLLSQFHISSQLPRPFTEALRRGMKRTSVNLSLNSTAEAFRRIGDPIVIVHLRGKIPKLVCSDAIVVEIGATPQKDNIMRILFPRTGSCLDQRSTAEANAPDLCKGLRHPDANLLSSPDANMSSGNGSADNLKMKWALFQEISDAILSTEKRRDGNLTSSSDFVKIKVELQDSLNILAAGVHVQKSHPVGNGNLFGETSSMLQELNELSSLFHASDFLSAKNMARMGFLLMSLQSRRPKLENFLNQLSVPKEAGAKQISDGQAEENVDKKESIVCNRNDSRSTAVASASQSNDQSKASECNQGKGNNRKKSKKGKGGRKK
ncbi:hypothetical protein ACH5RR_032121 [Cinchona calisaya]|uniref:UvrD-like helicase ATP-binding domain-containing protein n=1 Tax=Cinchona calisaya TaxID=153742 RepID=A0ABD2YL97_9GENT